MNNKSAAKIKPVSLDELLGGISEAENRVKDTGDSIVEVPLDQLYAFKDHPFLVKDDEKMAETIDSIRISGVLVPGIARPRETGGYEIISGHRRHRGAQLAGLATMPILIKELSDADAKIIMVDSNIQREDLLYSEKASAYRMKYEALKEKGLADTEGEKRLDQALAEKSGESRNTIQRYIRLTYLIPELMNLTDNKKLGFIAASDLSYLTVEEQNNLLQMMQETETVASGIQAVKMKEYSKNGKLTPEVMEVLLKQEKNAERIVFKTKQLKDYFPEEYGVQQMTDVIFRLLEDWKQQNL